MIQSVDLYTVQFWGFVFLAAIVLIPLGTAVARERVLAVFNVAFIGLYLRGLLPWVVVGAAAIWLGLRDSNRRHAKKIAAIVGLLTILGLFVFHKLPHETSALAQGSAKARLSNILTMIGFSYVALRLIDLGRAVFEGRYRPPSLTATINYLLPFHMLAAGPIESYDEFVARPKVPAPLGPAAALRAFERIAGGLFKKYILALFIDRLFLTGFRGWGPYLLIEMPLDFLWLYLDFSAYSDVAVGIGALIGVKTPENFNRPYLARNVIDFWERWHISLSQFIRRTIFFPVQMLLMRRTDGKWPLFTASAAFMVSFLLCGFWHGVDIRWVGWGAFQALGLIACNLYRQVLLNRLGRKGLKEYMTRPFPKALGMIATFYFQGIALAIATFPLEGIAWWSGHSY